MSSEIVNLECNMLKYVRTKNIAGVSNQLQSILDTMFPPKVEIQEDGSRVNLRVSSLPTTRHDLDHLKLKVHTALSSTHQAKLVGLCPIRRVIYDQLFDEIIRQVTISCSEQGLLLFQVRNELKMTLNAYKSTYESGLAFGVRKAIQNDELLMEAREKIECMKLEQNLLNQQVEDSIRNEKTLNQNNLDILSNIKKEYDQEIKTRDVIIKQQRLMIEALTRKSLEIEN